MQRRGVRFAIRLYRALAWAFPHEFQMAYGDGLTQLGEDFVEEVATINGIPGLFRLVADLAVRLPVEYLSEMRRDLIDAMRTLWKSWGFASAGILSLGGAAGGMKSRRFD